ncbi:MAG TPA: hypothetical protein VFV41_21335 [Streptosporangiaceae bacterium]|nr:hypothetical protein [Streptosporangiaceae bacterium]
MTEPATPHATTLPSASGPAPRPRPATAAPRRAATRIGGVRAVGGGLITRLRTIMRGGRRRQPPAPTTPGR